MSHDMRFLDPERVHKTGTVAGKQARRVRDIGLVAPAQAALIINQDLIVLGKRGHLKDAPGGEADTRAGDAHQRVALAVQFVVEIDVIDFDFA